MVDSGHRCAVQSERLTSIVRSNATNGWISVKDRLPEDRTLVIATCGGDEYVISFYRDGDFYFNDVDLWNCKAHNVTHWLIPEPPEV